MANMEVKPLSDALGVEVSGIDVAKIDDDTFADLRNIFHKNLINLNVYFIL